MYQGHTPGRPDPTSSLLICILVNLQKKVQGSAYGGRKEERLVSPVAAMSLL